MEQYREFWEESFDRLDDYLKTVTAKKQIERKETMAAKSKSNEIADHPRLRRPRRRRVGRLDRPRAGRAVVGPARLHAHHAQQDLRPGGHWTYTMHGPDGTDYPNKTIYHEVENAQEARLRPRRQRRPPAAVPRDRPFRKSTARRTLDMTMALATPEAAEEIAQVHQEGRRRLDLGPAGRIPGEGIDAARRQFVINRSFDAPLERVFEMWTDPKHFAQVAAADRLRDGVPPGRHQARRQRVSTS